MKKINLDTNKPSKEEIDSIATEINAGRVVVLPTDTIYGLSALASDKRAIDRIYKIKKRDRNKPLVILMKSFCMLRRFCKLNKGQYKYIKEDLERGSVVTVILTSKGAELNHLVGQDGSMAVRIPKRSKLLIKLIKKINKPIVSTSLNLSGDAMVKNLDNVENIFQGNEIALVVNGGGVVNQKSSKIVDIRDIDNPVLIRS